MKSKGNAVITVRLPKNLKQELEDIASEENVPVSDLMRDSLNHFLDVRRFRLLRKKVLPFAEAQNLLTDEEIFKTIS